METAAKQGGSLILGGAGDISTLNPILASDDLTFQVVGSPKAPVLQVNMMSAVAPGILRKLFEFRGTGGQTGQIPDPIRER